MAARALVRSYAPPLVAAGATMVALAAVMLHPYVVRDFRFPLGWDSPFYIWRTAAVGVDGLERVGAIRAGFPLLLASLRPLTGSDAYTLVALVPGVLLGVAGLAGAAMTRAAFAISTAWVPVVGFLAWAAFGPNEIPLHHFDNLLNAALVLAAFASALAFVRAGRGAVAVAVLLAAAGVAHWPFFAFALAVFVPGLLVWAALERRRGDAATVSDAVRRAVVLLGATAGAVAAVAATVLAAPPTGWVGARPRALREILQERIRTRLGHAHRFLALPLALAAPLVLVPAGRDGDGAGDGAPRDRTDADAGGAARRLFLLLMAVWGALTVVAVVAQLAGLPTAGARMLSFLFPMSLLTGLLVWRIATGPAAARSRPIRGVAALLVAATVLGFGSLMWSSWSARHPWFEEEAVEQAAAAGAYVASHAPGRPVVYLLHMRTGGGGMTLGRWWLVVKAALPPEQVRRAFRYVGSADDFLSGRPSAPLGVGLPPGESDRPGLGVWDGSPRGPVAIVLARYNRPSFQTLATARPERLAAPGVLVLRGPAPSGGTAAVTSPDADTAARTMAWVLAAATVLLFAAGIGWSVALLPPDPVLRVALAPAFGAGVTPLAALVWERLGGSLAGAVAAVPLLLAALGGWIAAALAARRRRGSPPSRPQEERRAEERSRR